MRIAFDGEPLRSPLAGIGHYTRELVRALAAAGEDDRLFVVAPLPVRALGRGSFPGHFTERNVDVVVPGWIESVRAKLGRTLGRGGELGRDIDPPCDVFHATNNIFPFAVRAARRVLTIHDLTLLRFPEWHPADRLARMAGALAPSAARADRIITPSASARSDVVELLRVEPDRVTVVPEGVSSEFAQVPGPELEALLAPLGLAPDGYFLFMGTLEPRKNLLRLLEALERSGTERPLAVAGGSGWRAEAIDVALTRLAALGRVRRLGYVADALRPALLSGARAFLYPSLYEGFGLPPLEAMACGAPVVTSNVSSLPEVVGDAALLVDPEDVDALASAIARVDRDQALRGELRGRGLARAREFTWERTARLTREVYRAALEADPIGSQRLLESPRA